MELRNDTITISSEMLKRVKTEKSKLDVIKERINNNFYNSEKVIDYTASQILDRIEGDLEVEAIEEEKQPSRFGASAILKAAFLLSVGFVAAYMIFIAIMTAVNGGVASHISMR